MVHPSGKAEGHLDLPAEHQFQSHHPSPQLQGLCLVHAGKDGIVAAAKVITSGVDALFPSAELLYGRDVFLAVKATELFHRGLARRDQQRVFAVESTVGI